MYRLAEAWRKQMENPEAASLSFDERFGQHLSILFTGPTDLATFCTPLPHY
jgi:hypothetical protein